MSTSNIGETGIKSIRLGGMKVEDLPIRESALTAVQLPLVEDAERQTKIEGILHGKPKQRVSYLKSRIVECEENIKRISKMKEKTQEDIQQYIGHISLCKFRDKEIEKVQQSSDSRTRKRKRINNLNKQFPPYNVEMMQQQITQWEEAIQRADEVIAQEYKSISEFREVLTVCVDRDAQLKKLGVQVVAG